MESQKRMHPSGTEGSNSASSISSVSRYKKIKKLGEGAHGMVYLASVQSYPSIHPSDIGNLSSLSHAYRNSLLKEEVISRTVLTEEQKEEYAKHIRSKFHYESPLDVDFDELLPVEITSDIENIDTLANIKRDISDVETKPVTPYFPPLETNVAVKKMLLKSSNEGISRESVREIKLLREIRHPNVVSVYDSFIRQDNQYMVMEALPNDLERIIRDSTIMLDQSHIKAYLQMTLQGLAYLHSKNIMHRDLKPANILMSPQGILKIADFGGAKITGSPDRRFSPQACTLWYRAPELLFGSEFYGPSSDIWSLGCIFAEMLLRSPLFRGDRTELSQQQKIVCIMGPPTKENWCGVENLRDFKLFSTIPKPEPWEKEFAAYPPSAVDLLSNFLQYDPNKRLSAKNALNHPYFKENPLPCEVNKLPGIKNSQTNNIPTNTNTKQNL